ncbi:hypothetical protein CR513_47576, partial [Mucuna pruriens]
MAFKAITGFRGEGTEAKGSIGNVAIDGIATRRGQADPFGSTTAEPALQTLELQRKDNDKCFLSNQTPTPLVSTP